MHVWNALYAARWKYRTQKNRHFGTIAQICRPVSSHSWGMYRQSEKNLLNGNTSSTSPHNGELRATNGWDLLASLWHPFQFQRLSRLGSVTARHSSSELQPNFAALNRGRHLYSAGRPSRWALAHILVYLFFNVYYICGPRVTRDTSFSLISALKPKHLIRCRIYIVFDTLPRIFYTVLR